MIAQWDSSLSVLPMSRVLPTRPEPAWQKIAQSSLNDTTQPVGSEEEGRSSTMDRQWLIE